MWLATASAAGLGRVDDQGAFAVLAEARSDGPRIASGDGDAGEVGRASADGDGVLGPRTAREALGERRDARRTRARTDRQERCPRGRAGSDAVQPLAPDD